MPKKTTTETGEQPTGKEIRIPSDNTMKVFASALNEDADSKAEASEALSESKAAAIKKQLQVKPFKLAKDLADAVKEAKNQAIAGEKLARFLAHFDHYRKFFKLDELANLQGRMFGTGEIGGGEEDPPRETDEDGQPDVRPRHLRQPGASAAAAVQDMAERAGASPRKDEDALKNVGRGTPDTTH